MMNLESAAGADAGLTEEQRRIVEVPPAARLLVTAGPGTGKTHVLVARLAELIEVHRLRPGDEILVLSFSRAAVNEIRKRLAAADGDVGYARAYTFDSFAGRLLAEFAADQPLTGLNYDARVRAAMELIRRLPAARTLIDEFRHVCVDEVQDLVGDRAEFVKAILEALNPEAGFTLLGDPAQGIYNFQLPEGSEERRIGSAALYTWLRQHFGRQLQDRSLTVNHRAQSDRAREAATKVGAQLSGPNPDYGAIKPVLKRIVLGLSTLGKLEHAVSCLRRPGETTAVLCPTNGQALVISRALHCAGSPHRLQRPATERVVPAWIADVFSGLEQQQIGRSAFLRRAEERLPVDGPSPSAAWAALKRLEGQPGQSLDLTHVAARIVAGRIPDELIDHPMDDLIVSTIHRAKGLEFERVVVVDSNGYEEDDSPVEIAEAVRLLYVALTRPRRELLHMAAPTVHGLQVCNRTDRWVRWYHRGRTRVISECELRGSDMHSFDPAGGFVACDSDPAETQAYIREAVHPGDEVRLTAVESDASGETQTYYVVRHQGRVVGVTSADFGSALYTTLKLYPSWTVHMPTEISDLYVEGVDTVAGSPAASRRAGLGVSGLWLRVRVGGLGQLHFSSHKQEE
jgi:hypothetical protein